MIPRPDRSVPCGKIVFPTFCRCMSFYTARVKIDKTQYEHNESACPLTSDMGADIAERQLRARGLNRSRDNVP